jgi:hypothetical protein
MFRHHITPDDHTGLWQTGFTVFITYVITRASNTDISNLLLIRKTCNEYMVFINNIGILTRSDEVELKKKTYSVL